MIPRPQHHRHPMVVVVVVQAALMPKVHSKADIELVLMMIQMQVSLMEFLALMAAAAAAVVEEKGGIEEEARVGVGEEEEEGCTIIIIIRISHLSRCHHWVKEGQQEGLVERSILIRHSDKTAINIDMLICILFPFVCRSLLVSFSLNHNTGILYIYVCVCVTWLYKI
jgi:hypothetical protein